MIGSIKYDCFFFKYLPLPFRSPFVLVVDPF
uniref:Uncharacterized protein n=1 Tax=Arundo donax TaxID=35708 RepID=A0A0A9ATQ7_ARUDO